MSSKGALTVLLGAVLSAAGVFGLHELDARAAGSETLVLALGDRARVEGGDVGCRVTRVAGARSRLQLDCRRAGPLRGTYGTFFDEERVLVVRFLDSRTARVVFRARHEGAAGRCD